MNQQPCKFDSKWLAMKLAAGVFSSLDHGVAKDLGFGNQAEALGVWPGNSYTGRGLV
jgi:hypothetical protein